MATNNTIGLNIELPIYNSDGSSFHGLVLHKCTYDSVVMSLGDKITGDVYYNGNTLAVTMQEYVELDGVKFVLVTPPTVVREGMVSENSQLNGMTKYSFVFYHPMYMLGNFPFTDVAVTSSEAKYLSESKKFTWIGYPDDFIAKVNKNLDGTEWIVEKSSRFPAYLDDQLSDVLSFDGNTIADACKMFYDTWGAPYIVAKVESTEAAYANGKRFKVIFGLPSNEIYEDATHQQSGTPYIFRFGKGVGLKNNSRTPRGNKIVTRIAGSGSENNIPYGYPQIPWYGDSRWDYTEYEGSTINYDSDGHVTNTPKTTAYPLYMGIVGGAYVKLIKHPFTRTNLMPSIYGQTLFNKVSPYLSDGTANPDYDPNTTLIDYYDAIATQEYPYPNPIVANAPSYESHQFEDIKPELGQNAAIVDAYPVNKDMTPAQAWDDSMDDDGNYVQSYFKMQLPVLSFDLYACAAITQEMQINMRSGACLGCTFTIQVDWDDYKRNFYDDEGNFAPTGSQRDYTKYPDSSQEQITVVLQKETATFGTLMPNMYQYPVADDTFVVLGISLPLSYIESAEERLDGEMKSYMLENNVHYFDYPLKFDEAFLRNNPYILSQIKPNSVVRFQYGNDTMQLFVKQMSVKYGEGVLPKYDITLTDNVEVVLNRIGQVAEDVEKLASLIAILRQNYNRSVWNELAKKLSKTQDDTAAGYITMLKGLQVGANFVPDILGEGGVLRMRDDGKVELVTDILYARVKAYFDSVEIREYQHTGGNRIASVAGNKICRVVWFNSSNVELEQTQANLASVAYFRCYFRASDDEDTVRNNWVIGDQAYCHITSVTTSSDNPEQKGLNQKHLWRLVIGRNTEGTLTEDGEAYIDLSNRATETISGTSYTGYQSGSDIPEAQDDIIQLGNVNDTTRQGAIVEFVTGTDAPSYQIYQGINSFSLNNKNQIGFGYNTGTGRAYMNVYGNFRFGARPNTQGSYLEYNSQTGALNIKAHVEFTNTDQELDTLVQNHQRDDSYDDTEVRGLISGLQEQIDGQIETWFYNYSPVNVDASGAPTSNVPLNVAPYSDWTTDNDKIAHLGDTFTNNSTGYCWRFTRNEETNAFEWVIIEDSAVIAALQNAAKAQDTADHKRRVFICDSSHQTPTPPYDAGDLWVNVKYPWATGATYDNEILKCVTSKASGSFAIADWSLANGYTAKLNNFVNNTYAPFVQNIQGQVDKKAETFRQATDPSSSWTDADKPNHVGDLWMDISADGGKKTKIYQNIGTDANPVYDWVEQEVPDEVFDEIDGKAEIFVTKPTTYNERDMWIIESGTAAADIPTGCQVGDIVVSNHKRTNSYTKGDWSKKDRYTDDSAFNGYINAFLNGTGASGDSATAAAIQKAIAGALGSGTIVDGGLLLTSLIGMRKNTGTTENPVYETWAGISGQYDDWSGNTHAKGHGIAAWYGGAMVDKEDVQTLPASYAKSLFRFDGSGYLASGNITWNENGSLTIKNITTLSDSNNNNILNELATFNSAFTFGTSGQGSTTALYITPNVPFESLYIGTSNANKKEVATQEWVGNNYVSTAFFRQLFRAFKPNATAGQADVEVQPNTIDATISNIKAMVGLWTEQYISALGRGADGGGGGASVLYGLNDVTPNATGDGVMGAQDGYVLTYNGTTNHWYAAPTAETYVLPTATSDALGGIKIGYAASGKNYAIVLDANGKAYVNVPWTDHYAWSDITSKPNTIAGYGITDAKIENGVITLGSNTITPLTSHQSLADIMGSTAIGGTTQPVYWTGSAFANTSYTLGKSVPSDAVFTDHYDWTDITSKPTTLSDYGITDGLYSTEVSAAQNNVTWAQGIADSIRRGFYYNTNGTEWSYLFGLSSSSTSANKANNGAILKMGYNDKYLRILRVHSGTWQTSDWEKISSGYADSAGDASTLGGTSKSGLFTSLTSASDTKLSITIGGTTKTLSTLYASYAAQLTTSRTLWGQSFNGTANVSGSLTGVGNITMGSTDGTYIKIGDIYIGYDSTNSAIEIYKLGDNNAHVAANLYAHGAISALGQGVDGGGGGTGDVTWTLLADNNDTRQIALSHLTTALSTYATQSWVSNTLSPYATQQWVGQQGFLTSISAATATALGGIKVGYTTSGNNYKVQLDSSNNAYVYVPWTTYTNGTGLALTNNQFSINSTYQTYISNGNTAYGWGNHANAGYALASSLNSYLPLTGGTLTGGISCLTSGANLYWGNITIYGGGSNGGINSIWIGDDVCIGDCNIGGCFGMKSTSADTGFRFFNSSGTSIGGLQSTAGTLQWIDSAGTAYDVIHSGNIGSQSVNYATSAGKATNDSDGNAINSTYLKLSGGTMTGNIAMPDSGWVQSRIITGESGGSTSQYKRAHSIELGWPSKDMMDFFEYGGVFNFYLTQYVFQAESGKGTLVAQINSSGITSNGFAKNGSSSAYVLTGDGGHAAISGLSVNYATSAGNADTLDSLHEDAFLRARNTTNTNGETTYWSQIGIKEYHNALPDGLSGVYNWGEAISLCGVYSRFDIYCNHHSSDNDNLYFRSGWDNDKKAWRYFIHSGNIGSQSVNYATSAGSADSVAWSNITSNPFTIGGSVADAYVNGTTYSTLNTGTYTHQLSDSSESVVHFQCGGSASGLDLKFHYPQKSDSPLYYRKTIDSNRFASTSWVTIIDSLNIGSQSVNYATSAGSATNDSDGNAINSTYLKKSGGTMTGLLKITTNSRTVTIGAQNNGAIHIYNDNSSPTFFNGSVSSSGNGSYDLGTTNYYWRYAYLNYGKIANYANIGLQVGEYTTGRAMLSVISSTDIPADIQLGANGAHRWQISSRASADSYELRFYRYPADTLVAKFDQSSNFVCQGGITCLTATSSSDIRLKDVQGNVNLNVEQVADAPAIRFLWKKDHSLGMQAGSIAQYWQNVLPETIKEDNEGILSMNYGVAALVAAITTARKVVDHEKRIRDLERENEILKKEVERLKIA